ncbi:tumor necrosis factor receptor superfamily member 1A [Siniperca chuatsi]|uniref:tumor necrosis factor receptor superfamily member 1A n=1 Tax=Siniperca chuatsi TaxID=119488 RepID=UPI001CE0F282|nr:tumor necrosis factor receptor superfamily member 1A [Siniperca chuatsi]
MDFVLVFPLLLAFLSTGESYTEVTEQTTMSCYAVCPPGYHKVGACNDPGKHRCEKCDNGTFTEKHNLIQRCLRCESCGHYEVEIKPCSFNSNVVCDCKEGYYSTGSNPATRFCRSCHCKNRADNNPDYKRKCQHCQSKGCLKDPECKRNSTATTVPPSTNPPTTTTTSATTSTTIFMTKSMTSTATAISTRTTASDNASTPTGNPFPNNLNKTWLYLMGVMATFLVLFWLLLFTKNLFRYPDSCPCWSPNKDLEPPVEDPKSNEQHSHRDDSPTTLTFTISEETPMMTLSQSPATPEHAAHIRQLLPAARQDEQSEHWPAIVLYAIIKEVPLRRWKEFLRLLSVADQQLERVELEAGLGLGSLERQYQMLRLWSQRSSASLNDVFSALHCMDLSGCAQLLQESLEKLQWRPKL